MFHQVDSGEYIGSESVPIGFTVQGQEDKTSKSILLSEVDHRPLEVQSLPIEVHIMWKSDRIPINVEKKLSSVILYKRGDHGPISEKRMEELDKLSESLGGKRKSSLLPQIFY